MNLIHHLETGDIQLIADSIKARQDKYEEDFVTSVGVVLMNYGDKYKQVRCVNGEWHGQKKDLLPRDGVPHCPNGHVLLEAFGSIYMALIED